MPDRDTTETFRYSCDIGTPVQIVTDADTEVVSHKVIGAEEDFDAALQAADIFCGNIISHQHAGSDPVTEALAKDGDGGPGGRLSSVSLSGGFGTITVGRIWSASYNHYGAKLDPTWFKGSGGGVTYTIGNTVSYSSSAGDVSFQIDKVTGTADADKMLQFGASAALGPMGIGLGYWSAEDDSSFTGVALTTGAGGIGLAVGLGSSDAADGSSTDTSLISLSGALGDSGISYGVQVANSDNDKKDQNLVSVVNALGPGAAIHFEHLDPGDPAKDASSHIVLRVDF